MATHRLVHEVQERSCAALSNIAGVQEYQQLLLDPSCPCLPLTLAAMDQHVDVPKVQQKAGRLLWKLAEQVPHRVELVQHHKVLRQILRAMNSHPTETAVQEECRDVLLRLGEGYPGELDISVALGDNVVTQPGNLVPRQVYRSLAELAEFLIQAGVYVGWRDQAGKCLLDYVVDVNGLGREQEIRGRLLTLHSEIQRKWQQRLFQTLTEALPQIHPVDVLGTVAEYCWWHELHPEPPQNTEQDENQANN
eukprot:TRINITY_DN6025_c0_g1_i4.p1 TRINITY_DN6025_c0_g1~~TRINITY_DN6025_c0_g1_i4.p1  ORF type:complete len:250 (-),score=47.90 TRINITY_DN6025_c0_g1_i4:77-826(-)